jgi:tetratricopeptide (TPR) repeat protein
MADDMSDNNPHPMSQDEIDALFDQLAKEVPSQEEDSDRDTGLTVRKDDEAEPAPEPTLEPGEDGTTSSGTMSNLRQSDIDQMIGGLGEDESVEMSEDQDEPVSDSEDTARGQEHIDAVLTDLEGEASDDEAAAEEPPAEEAKGGEGPLGQDDIDALLAGMGADEAAEAEPDQTAEPADGPLGQDDIDALMAQMEGAEEKAPAEAEAESAASDDDEIDASSMAQSEIDALLKEMGTVVDEPEPESELAAAPADSTVGDGGLDQSEIDSLLTEMNADPDAEPVQEAAAEDADATMEMDQAGIDSLLANMDADTGTAGGGDENEEGGTGRLSTQQINNILQKQEETATTEGQEAGESMISQGDIDALVSQMSMATGVPGREEIDDLLAEKEQDIEALLEEVQNKADMSDAVQGTMQTPAVQSVGQVMLPSGTAVMAPEELRGTRYLLIAAVLLLTMCTVTMVFVAQAINGLTDELYAGRTDQVSPQDDYDSNVAVGLELLQSDDLIKVTKGLDFFEHMKRQYPARIPDLSMMLADHHRSRSAWRRAVEEYVEIAEHQGEYVDDPQFYLEYSDSLYRLERFEQAQQVLQRLLANEDRFGQAVNSQGRARPDEVVRRERETLQRAYLLLGRLYTARLERLPSVAAERGRAEL